MSSNNLLVFSNGGKAKRLGRTSFEGLNALSVAPLNSRVITDVVFSQVRETVRSAEA